MTLELYMERSYFLPKDSFIFLFGIKGEKYSETAAVLYQRCKAAVPVNHSSAAVFL